MRGKITKEKVKDLLYDIRNEFENEIDDYETDDCRELTENDINMMFEFLDKFISKFNLTIDDELKD